ncbi:MAG: IclR family transcriptional regulator [Pseudorhodoplanes sp.]|uniref:IclR family transcriptional regulator n=1 Tax=Pseudorhodoplanes sp. TaxID=1934341 RepID=UPI003D10E196
MTGPSGSQSIRRAAQMMKIIARYGSDGARLSDIVRQTRVTRPTVHRILRALIDEDLVLQNETTRRYHLDQVIHQLALVAFRPMDIVAKLRPLLVELARDTRDTAYLMAMSGYDIVCLDRIDGDFPVRAYTFEIGRRSPLGAGAASLVFLSLLSDSELERLLEVNGPALREYGYQTVEALRTNVIKARRRGVGISHGRIAAGVVAVSVLIPNPAAVPFLAFSVAAVSGRMSKERVAEVAKLLLKLSAKASRILES